MVRLPIMGGLLLCLMAGLAEGFAIQGFNLGRRLQLLQKAAGRVSGRPGLCMCEGPESIIPGNWKLEAELEEADLNCFLSLNGDRTVTLPPGSDVEGKTFPSRAFWKSKGKTFVMEFDRNRGATSPFFDLVFTGKLDSELMLATGTVMAGEYEPEYVGKFKLKQIMKSGQILVEEEVEEEEEIPPPPPGSDDWNGEVNEEVWFDDE